LVETKVGDLVGMRVGAKVFGKVGGLVVMMADLKGHQMVATKAENLVDC